MPIPYIPIRSSTLIGQISVANQHRARSPYIKEGQVCFITQSVKMSQNLSRCFRDAYHQAWQAQIRVAYKNDIARDVVPKDGHKAGCFRYVCFNPLKNFISKYKTISVA